MILNRSRELLERAYSVIPSATQTFSKGPNQWARGVSPHFLERGEGAWVWDVDGNRYLDWMMALGPVSLGYGDAEVNAAIMDQLGRGVVFSQMNALEVEVAEMLVDGIPCAEMVRFGKNGSDATTAAIRAARALTGRPVVAACGYHGWHDWYIGTTTRNLGVPNEVQSLTRTFTYNDIASLEELFAEQHGRVACVIMEGVGVEPPENGFLHRVAELTRREGALLIFDEIVAGFRLALGGAHEHYCVPPDIACFGKAMANGMPLSAVVGHRDVMKIFDRIFFSGTFGGECLSLAACRATMHAFERRRVVDHLWHVGGRLGEGISALIEKHGLNDDMRLVGLPPRSVVSFPHADEAEALARRTLVLQECVKRGLLYSCSHVPCLSHGEVEVDFTLSVLAEVIPLFAEAVSSGNVGAKLEGPPVEAIFRRA